MKNKKLYEYVIDVQLDYQFLKRISINEQTKTVWFEIIVKYSNWEQILNTSKNDFSFEETNENIKEFLLYTIEEQAINLIFDLCLQDNVEYMRLLKNGIKINGKEFLLEDNKYAELKEKVLNEVKYGLH